MNTMQNGIWAGLLATGPMTLAMFALQKKLPSEEKSPLPPATLTTQITEQVGIDQHLSRNRREDLTMLSHFAYGAVSGIIYSYALKKIHARPLLKGSLFGLGIWAVSYLGWIPVSGLRANAFKMPARRNGLMILAHLIWGVSIAFSEKEMRQSGDQMLDGHGKARQAE